jgi:hypothetical protein
LHKKREKTGVFSTFLCLLQRNQFESVEWLVFYQWVVFFAIFYYCLGKRWMMLVGRRKLVDLIMICG